MLGLKTFYTQNKVTVGYLFLLPFLFIFSLLYGFSIFLLRLFYKTHIFKTYRSHAKVISVGNITLGGSGKTPLVEYLAALLARDGHRVAILLRGYKRPKAENMLGSEDYYASGDEASMLKYNLKDKALVLAGRDRISNARRLDQAKSVDTIILDDGFQHWALNRDLEIVTLDATNPFGTKLLLPAGHLRENLSSLKRADILCLSRCNEVPRARLAELESLVKKINPRSSLIRTIHSPEYLYNLKTNKEMPLNALQEQRVSLVCAIANPMSFFNTTKELGINVAFKRFFEDHHDFSEREMSDIVDESLRLNIKTILITEKDAQRLSAWAHREKSDINILVLRVVLKIISGNEGFHGRLRSLYYS